MDAKKIGGDTGYAGSANRNLCKELGIQTSFVKRGRPTTEKNDKDYVRQELARVRATAMEGSFGTQKEHYDMWRIKARKKKNGDPVHLLRHPHSERGPFDRAAGKTARARSCIGNILNGIKMESSAENSLSMVAQSDRNITKMMVRQQKKQ